MVAAPEPDDRPARPLETIAPIIEAARRAVKRATSSMLEAHDRAIEEKVAPLVPKLTDIFQHGVQQLSIAWKRTTPNLPDLDANDLRKLLDVSVGEAICLLWALRTEIVAGLPVAEANKELAAAFTVRA